jgi:O-antigen ligase
VTVHSAGLVAILLLAVAWLASGLHGGRLLSLSGLALFACLVAATVLPRGRGAATGVALFAVTLAIASGLFAALNFEGASSPCRHVCVLGSALTGVFPNENLFGTTLLAALPFAYLGLRGRARTWLVLYLAGMAVLTGSRGAMATAVVVVLALVVLRPRLDGDQPAPARTAVAGVLFAAALLASVFVVLHDWSSYATSPNERPYLWTVASDYIGESPVFGYGPDRWQTFAQTGEIPLAAEHSTHNQFVDVLFNAGWVGLAVLGAMTAAMIWSAGYARRAVLITLAALFMIGVTERAWQIGAADFATFSLIGVILLGQVPARPRRAPPRLLAHRYTLQAPSQEPIPAGRRV